MNTPQARAAQRRFRNYFDEFSGKKRIRRSKEIEYISRHGEIVSALRKWRQRALNGSEKFAKDAYIDLGVQSRDALCELYEVKSSCERQALYTATGQIVVHDDSPKGNCKRFLVLPNDEVVPRDVKQPWLVRVFPSFDSNWEAIRFAYSSLFSGLCAIKNMDQDVSRETGGFGGYQKITTFRLVTQRRIYANSL